MPEKVLGPPWKLSCALLVKITPYGIPFLSRISATLKEGYLSVNSPGAGAADPLPEMAMTATMAAKMMFMVSKLLLKLDSKEKWSEWTKNKILSKI